MFELVNPISAVNKAVLFGSFAGVFTLVAIVFAELFLGAPRVVSRVVPSWRHV